MSACLIRGLEIADSAIRVTFTPGVELAIVVIAEPCASSNAFGSIKMIDNFSREPRLVDFHVFVDEHLAVVFVSFNRDIASVREDIKEAHTRYNDAPLDLRCMSCEQCV